MKAVLKNGQKWPHLQHRLGNKDLCAKSSPPPVFINNIFLEHSHICFHIIYDCFCTTMADLSSCDRYHMTYKV